MQRDADTRQRSLGKRISFEENLHVLRGPSKIRKSLYFTFVFDEIKYLVSYIVYGLLHKYSGHVARGELQTLFAKGRY